MRPILAPLLIAACLPCGPALADTTPSASGDSGLIAMPDARVDDDGTLKLALFRSGPYAGLTGTMTVLPGLEGSFDYMKLDGVATPGHPEFGAYKDKQFTLKWRFLDEAGWRPALAVGTRDFLGTRLFPASYVVASKRLGDLDLTLGYGDDRIDGAFGGIRYAPGWARGFSVVAEHDANDYANDYGASQSGAATRTGTLNVGLEYRGVDWGVQLTSEGGEVGGKAWLTFAFGRPDLVPDTREPPPLHQQTVAPQPKAAWAPLSPPAMTLADQLYAQDFDKVEVAVVGTRLELRLTNNRISLIGRAVGRAARTALLFGPADMESLRITYTELDLAVASYEFRDLGLLRAYFGGQAKPEQLAPTITVRFARAEDQAAFRTEDLVYSLDALPVPQDAATKVEAGPAAGDKLLFIERSDRDGATFGVKPLVISGFFNDIGGAFRYDVFAAGYYSQRYAPGLYGTGTLRLTLLENVSDVSNINNSLLPHVRSDVALYKQQAGTLKMENLFLAKYAQLGERLYSRASIGWYEEMFFGAGAQVLYLPARGDWAYDVDVEYAHQRDYSGGFGLLDYHTVTALGAVHYRVPSYGLTFTLRGGEFLAQDEGVRFEVQRRLRSGVTFGIWYTRTNGDDITGPGTPDDPYYDKGVFISIPLRITLPYDTRSSGGFALAPWARDVGQMVRFPGDLYSLFEQTLLLNTTDYNPLSQLGR